MDYFSYHCVSYNGTRLENDSILVNLWQDLASSVLIQTGPSGSSPQALFQWPFLRIRQQCAQAVVFLVKCLKSFSLLCPFSGQLEQSAGPQGRTGTAEWLLKGACLMRPIHLQGPKTRLSCVALKKHGQFYCETTKFLAQSQPGEKR